MTGDVARFNSADEDNFTQAGHFFSKVLTPEQRERLVDNIASHLCNAQEFIQVRNIGPFGEWIFITLLMFSGTRHQELRPG